MGLLFYTFILISIYCILLSLNKISDLRYYLRSINWYDFFSVHSSVCNVGINRRRLASKLGVKCRPFTILTSAAKIYPSSGREIVTNYQSMTGPVSRLETGMFHSLYYTLLLFKIKLFHLHFIFTLTIEQQAIY